MNQEQSVKLLIYNIDSVLIDETSMVQEWNSKFEKVKEIMNKIDPEIVYLAGVKTLRTSDDANSYIEDSLSTLDPKYETSAGRSKLCNSGYTSWEIRICKKGSVYHTSRSGGVLSYTG